jgi:hypothetical protein
MRSIVRLWPALLCACVAVASAAPAATSTSKIDAAARARLVGTHRLSLQWISWGELSDAGRAIVTDRGGTLSIRGEQVGRGDSVGDYVRIDGRIVAATRDGFTFEGDVLTRVSHIAGGTECRRHGTFHFATTLGRKYWRLQEMDNPCDSATDYVDVYFRGI